MRINVKDLSYDELRAACVGLVRTISGLWGITVNPDHYRFWAWAADVVLYGQWVGPQLPDLRGFDEQAVNAVHHAMGKAKDIDLLFSRDEYDLEQLFRMAVSALYIRAPAYGPVPPWTKQAQQSAYISQLMRNGPLASAYLSFPLLKGCSRSWPATL